MSRTFRPSTLSTVLAAAAFALAAAPASAATWSKMSTADGSNCNSIVNGTNYASAPTSCKLNGTASADADAVVSAWGNTGTNGAWSAAKVTNQGASGFGVRNAATSSDDGSEGTSPEHALDNNQRTDAILYSFDKTVALNSLVTGWSSTDQDITVLRYTGTGAPTMSSFNLGTGATPASNMLGNGWALMGNYAFTPTGGQTSIALGNTGNWASSHWLVMAYSTAFGSTIKGSSNASQTLTGGNDFFKLLSVSGVNSNKVSEPTVLALAGLGLFGVAWSRRAKKQAA